MIAAPRRRVFFIGHMEANAATSRLMVSVSPLCIGVSNWKSAAARRALITCSFSHGNEQELDIECIACGEHEKRRYTISVTKSFNGEAS